MALKQHFYPAIVGDLAIRSMFSPSQKRSFENFQVSFLRLGHIFGFSIALGDFLFQGVLDLAARLISPSRFETIQFFVFGLLQGQNLGN